MQSKITSQKQGLNQAHTARRKNQQGIALFVVIVLVMLSMLLALWASRTSLFGEMLVGNDADYQRTFEAAQALLQDAELDIRGETASGTLCSTPPCRQYSSALQFPADSKEINPLITKLGDEATRCKDALCARRVGRQDFWNYENEKTSVSPDANTTLGEVSLSAMTAVGARYGQYTGAAHKTDNGQLNPILTETADGKGGWYWIEIMRYSDSAKTANLIVDSTPSQLPLNLDVYAVYRITALAKGRKDGSTVVLQETYARQRMKD